MGGHVVRDPQGRITAGSRRPFDRVLARGLCRGPKVPQTTSQQKSTSARQRVPGARVLLPRPGRFPERCAGAGGLQSRERRSLFPKPDV